MSKITYVPRDFGDAALTMIEQANQIITVYQAQDLVLTLRQLYYRFVADAAIPNTERSYKRLGSIINDARLAGLIDWEAIEDRGRSLNKPASWRNPGAIIDAAASSYALDLWAGQDHRVEVWVEKQALESVVGQACDPLGVPYFACKGYVSQSEMWRASLRFREYQRRGATPIVIHLGDHDPSGIDMTRDIADRLAIFRVPLAVKRIALNMDQVEEHQPPPNPAKLTDSRCAGYIERFGDESWELDALEPATLRDLITGAVEEHLDRDTWQAVHDQQEAERSLLQRAAERWDDIVADLEEETP